MGGLLIMDRHVRAALSRAILPGVSVEALIRRLMDSPKLADHVDAILIEPHRWRARPPVREPLDLAPQRGRGPVAGWCLPTQTEVTDPSMTISTMAGAWRRQGIGLIEWRAHRAPLGERRHVNAAALTQAAISTIDAGFEPVLTLAPDSTAEIRAIIERLDEGFIRHGISWRHVQLRVGLGAVGPDMLGPAWGTGGARSVAAMSSTASTEAFATELQARAALPHAPTVTFALGRALARIAREVADPFDLDQIEDAMVDVCRLLDHASSVPSGI